MKQLALISLLSVIACLAHAGEWSGNLDFEARLFSETPADNRQHGDNLSFSAEPEYYTQWDNGDQAFNFKPFVRVDQHDNERSHADIRELSWLLVGDSWELRSGIRKEFWGVTESQHLVDIINQTDLVENPDGEDKLGQPMVNFAWITDKGTFDFFVLPYFRERTFPGIKGRLRSSPYVDTDKPVYENANQEKHIDYALRWSHSIDIFDVGLSHFYGTNRTPRLVAGLDASGRPAFIPHYDLINQTGLDVQATIDSWLLKFEAIHQRSNVYNFYAATAGFEYTLYGVFNSAADIGLLTEYMYDDRDNLATTPFADDVLLGMRLTLNDEQSTELLVGVIQDLNDDSRVFSIESSRRIDENWKLSVEARVYQNIPTTDLLVAYLKDDYLQINLGFYY